MFRFSEIVRAVTALAVMTVATHEVVAEDIDFVRQIRPILSDKCFACHGPDEASREADLRLDVFEEVFLDRGGYAAIVPGDLDQSEVWFRITEEPDSDLHMPPAESGKDLSPDERELIGRWIEQGAPWSAHWAYVAPQKRLPPESSPDDAITQWIDQWIAIRLRERGLDPSPAADRITLIRRLSFDLRGLPPTIEEVAAFVHDDSEDAYERLVDRYLNSEQFGERMAVYWLDLVRYADTVGYHGDQDQNISPYRDYVIDAFNRNKPFDLFTIEQLAGDLLDEPTTDAIVATGYNRLLQTSHEGGVQPKEYLTIYAADRVRNVSAVWMGATVGCAQCHNHKYDPYTARDFYSLAAFFADIDEEQHFKVGSNALPTRRPPEIPVLSRADRDRLDEINHAIDELQMRIDSLGDADSDAQFNDQRVNDQREKLSAELQQLASEKAGIEANAQLSMITVQVEPRPTRVLPRGNWLDDSGELVDPAVPSFLGAIRTEGPIANRLDLAHWLTDPDQGIGLMTARVMANRFWYLMFGQGLSSDLSDFGGQGTPPVHPELLDLLAIHFVESGWDVHAMIKAIVMSDTYRQSSRTSDEQFETDPRNIYFGRQSRRRLAAEFIRDNALSIGGLLNDTIGGPSVKPYQPPGYYQHLNFPTRTYEAHLDDRQWRRGLYVHWQRQFLHPMLRAFDAPRREECTAERPRSNTPIAAMVLLNDPTFVESAKGLALRVVNLPEQESEEQTDQATRQPDDFERRLIFAVQLTLSRNPDEFETHVLRQVFDANREHYRSDPEAATALLSVGLTPADEETDLPQLAAWTMVARVLLNLSETMTRP